MPEVDLPSDTEFEPETEAEKGETESAVIPMTSEVDTSSAVTAKPPSASCQSPQTSSVESEAIQSTETAKETTTTPAAPSESPTRDTELVERRFVHYNNPRLRKLNDLKSKVNSLFELSEREWTSRHQGMLLPPLPTTPAVKIVTQETDTNSICENLKLLPLTLPEDGFPENYIPSVSFPSIKEAIFWAMKQASTRHYQLVPRHDEKTDIWTLHCDRMAADDIDQMEEEQYAQGQKRKHESELNEDRDGSTPYKECHCKIERGTPRKNCNFKMTIERTKDENGFVLKQATGECSIHNHAPSLHIAAHSFDNADIFSNLSLPHFTEGELRVEELTRKRLLGASSVHGGMYLSKAYLNSMYRLKQLRLNKQNPFEVVRELIKNPLLRGAVQSDGPTDKSIFFAHTQGLLWWKAFPEVVIIDSKWGQQPRELPYYRAVFIRGVSSTNIEIPICVCLTQKTGPEIELQTWKWILEQYKKLMQEFQIPQPCFIQTDSDDNLLEACRTVMPRVFVQLEGEKRMAKSAYTIAKAFTSNASQRKKAVTKWEKIIRAPKMVSVFILLAEAEQWKKELFDNLEERLLRYTSQAWKNSEKHFHVKPMNETKDEFYVDRPLNILELVRGILKDFVDSYEMLVRSQARLNVYTEPGYDDFYDHVIHHISYLALKRVRDVDQSVLDKPCVCLTQGYPCAHEIREIKQQGRKLAVDDFHPHWRNIFADLHCPNFGGGKYLEVWQQIEIGFGKFSPMMDEEERAAKRVRRE